MGLPEKLIDYKLHHVLFWACFFLVWFALRTDDYPDTRSAWLAGTLKVSTLALCVYITNYLLIPRYLYRQRYWRFAAGVLLLIAVVGTLITWLYGRILAAGFSATEVARRLEPGRAAYEIYVPLLFMVVAAAGIQFYIDQLRTSTRLQVLLRQQAERELAYLKSQINPHALFNSLNTIYFLIEKENRQARETLGRFSELLRYQLYDCNADVTPIEKEVQYLRNYVSLQQLRKDSHYNISFTAGDDLVNFSIAPLLLIPFVENAFKHVSSFADKPNEIQIALQRQNGCFNLQVRNTCEAAQERDTGGIGLANVRRRLELLYPGRHNLDITETGTRYQVHLTIQLA